MKQNHHINISENGRSMIEILGVLAVIGVLSIGGVYGYRHAFSKHKANTIIQDAQLTYTELHGERTRNPLPWTPITWEPQSRKSIDKHRDNEGDDYVRVKGITTDECKQLVLMSVPPRITLFDEKGKRFETCAETNTIIFAFDGTRAPGINCERGSDCEQMGMYCQADDKVCQECPEGYKINAMGNGCDIICQSETQTTCELNNQYWCCENNLICGETVGSCEESDGACSYRINEQTVEVKSDCSYLYLQQTQTATHDCEYEIQNTSNGAIAKQIKGCPNGQFCNLRYSQDNCQGALTNESTGKMYGVCSSFNLALTSCTIKSVSNPMKVQKGCPKGQFCNLVYTNETCTERIPGNEGANVMYGVCSSMTLGWSSCPVQSSSDAVTALKKCPKNKYCYLAYTDETCTTTVNNNGADILYGVCNDTTKRNTTCPVKVNE